MGKNQYSKIKDEMKKYTSMTLALGICCLKEISTSITIRKAKFWSLEQTINEKRVVIVIRQILTGNKHFFSIMPKKHKGPKRDL